ncbi:MAG: hypothetical protein AAGI01_14060, partial [Myxococcota bacterium]
MTRPEGSTNSEHDIRRAGYVVRVQATWVDSGPGCSMNALARASGTSAANLTHYFGGRVELLRVVL